MDGLELAEKIKTKRLPVKVILLTAYKDFFYAQRGLNAGVYSYLVKHDATKEKIEETIKSVYGDIFLETEHRRAYLEKNLKSFLESGELESLNLGYEKYNFLLIDIVVRHNVKLSGEVELYTEYPVRLLEQELRTQHIFCKAAIKMSEASCVMILFVKKGIFEQSYHYQVQMIVNKAKKLLTDEGLDTVFFVSNLINHYHSIPLAYQKQKSHEPYLYAYDAPNCVYIEWCEEKTDNFEAYYRLKEKVFQPGSKEEGMKNMKLLFETGRQLFPQKQYLNELNYLALQTIRCGEKLLSTDVMRWKKEYQQIFTDLIGAEQWIMEIYGAYLREKEKAQEKAYSKIVRKSIEFMQKEYSENLTSEDICRHLGISESHFRRVFKIETGIKPMEYLNKYRIEVAKRLLQSGDYRIQDVYEMVGFTTSQYFSTVFKKYTGISPGQFQQTEE